MNHEQQGFVFRFERQLHKEFEFISRFASQRLNNGPPPPGAGSRVLTHTHTDICADSVQTTRFMHIMHKAPRRTHA